MRIPSPAQLIFFNMDAHSLKSYSRHRNKFKLSLSNIDPRLIEIAKKCQRNTKEHKILAQWAIDCTEKVLSYFEEKYPDDPRPRMAIKTLQEWMKTGVFKMSVIRKASLDSHDAAKEIGNNDAAAMAAHAAGQAVATAHVPAHALGSAIYAIKAVQLTSNSPDKAAIKERDWQYQCFIKLKQLIDVV